MTDLKDRPCDYIEREIEIITNTLANYREMGGAAVSNLQGHLGIKIGGVSTISGAVEQYEDLASLGLASASITAGQCEHIANSHFKGEGLRDSHIARLEESLRELRQEQARRKLKWKLWRK